MTKLLLEYGSKIKVYFIFLQDFENRKSLNSWQ
jgi:hypothetical protein